MNEADRPELSVVIPCYNEEANVEAICAAVGVEAARHALSYEIILIDNCSTDRTRALIRGICARDHRVRAIFNNRNYGQMRSPTHGIYQASGRAVIGMCADFQDPPALIGEFVRAWRAGSRIVLGQRRSEHTGPLLSLVRWAGYSFLRRYGDYPVIGGVTGFGLYDREVVDTLKTWNEPEPFFRGMLVESGFALTLVPFDRPERAAGESKNNVAALYSFAVSAAAGSARKLLRLPILLSLWAGAIAALLLAGALVALVAGGPALALLAFGLGSGVFAVLLLFLGLIGEQVRMIAERTRNAPLVIEEERINFPPEGPAKPAPSRMRSV
jgi:glycosyltransferase involved in cell wall biosynthesis